MNLNSQRPWITPLVIGTFLVIGTTGVLMFFHLSHGLNRTAHEWLGLVLVAAVALHVMLNLNAFKRYFTQKTGRIVIGVLVAVLALSFYKPASNKPRPVPDYAPIVHTLANAPMPVLAELTGVSTDELRHRLQAAGITMTEQQENIAAVAGTDLKQQIKVLRVALGEIR